MINRRLHCAASPQACQPPVARLNGSRGNKWLPTLLSSLLTLGCLSTSWAKSESEFQSKLQANKQRIQALQAQVEKTRHKRRQLLAKIQQAEQQIDNRDERIRVLKKDIQEYEQRVNALQQQLQENDTKVNLRKQNLAKMIRNSLKISANNGLQVMLQHTDPAMSSRLGFYYDHYYRVQKTAINEAIAQLEVSQAAHYEAVKSRNWLQHLKKKASGQRNQYSTAKQSSHSTVAQLDSSIKRTLKDVKSLTQEQTELNRLLEELRKNALGASGFFAAGKGKYPWPVEGRLMVRFGTRKSVGNLQWTGILIESTEGNRVRTIADGEIVYADWLQGFGMLVIVDHGDGYMTLYGGNRELGVKRGDWVEFGQTIATIGDSAGQKQPGLYFEIRHNAKPVNPESWIGTNNRFESADNKG